MRQGLVIGNWKMNGSQAANAALLAGLRTRTLHPRVELAVCPPFPYLAQAVAALQSTGITVGAQDVSVHSGGAYTGEVSAAMLADIGCRWVLCGHSERRLHHAETDAVVAHKAQAAVAGGLMPVVCIGETLAQRNAGQTLGVVAQQLAPLLALGSEALGGMVFAYEPVWAIGTGQSASPGQAQEVHAAIRASLAAAGAAQVRILYGGSVTSANAAGLFAMPDIDGALVGGASLAEEEFLIIAAALAME
ncbi:MAG: triose-phosphate isomerase [Castellaniella sp.]